MEKKKKIGNQRKRSLKNKSNLSDPHVRCPCDCEATKHKLVNNCLKCGKIVCSKEGPGPCFFCGSMVFHANNLISYDFSKEIDINSKGLTDKNTSDAYPVDTTLRDKLLEFDKDTTSRTIVIDDECDYYQVNNNWLTKTQREQWEKLESKTHNQKHKSRLGQKMKFDLTGRVYTEEEDPLEAYNKMNVVQHDRSFDFTSTDSHYNHYETVEGAVYIGNNLPLNLTYKSNINFSNRIQDKSLLEILDQGVCLSMHQPYASLLVKGIKKVEGRTWYSSHRGRLWIASAVKEAYVEDIKTIEEMYRLLTNETIDFPKTYPTGCLIGCVTITDVISQEEYIKLNSNEEIDSPYIFICENFIELPVKYPIQGKHKIYKLDAAIHRAALTCLEKMCRQVKM